MIDIVPLMADIPARRAEINATDVSWPVLELKPTLATSWAHLVTIIAQRDHFAQVMPQATEAIGNDNEGTLTTPPSSLGSALADINPPSGDHLETKRLISPTTACPTPFPSTDRPRHTPSDRRVPIPQFILASIKCPPTRWMLESGI